MTMIAKKCFLKLLPFFLVPSILSCSHFTPLEKKPYHFRDEKSNKFGWILKPCPRFLTGFTPRVIETPSFKKWVSSSDTPKVIAILPFTNETEVEGLDRLARGIKILMPFAKILLIVFQRFSTCKTEKPRSFVMYKLHLLNQKRVLCIFPPN
jgi:hypothetical protein